MDFIINRTNEDVMYAQSFATAIWSKMTNEQKEEWLRGTQSGQTLKGLKGFFNFTDMRRIKANYNSLISTYEYSGDTIDSTYSVSTIPNRTDLSADFEKVRIFARNFLPTFKGASFNDYRTPDIMTSDVNKMDYNFLNNYEHLLKNLYDYNANGELVLDCEFNYDTNSVEIDGYINFANNHEIDIKVPVGYRLTIQVGDYSNGNFTVHSLTTQNTTGNYVVSQAQPPHFSQNIIVESGIKSETNILNSTVTDIDVADYESISFECDMLKYSVPTTYTATEIQSDMVDVSDQIKMYCYDVSQYGDNTIVTLYDENEDMLDEIALREDTFIDLTDASYLTFDTDVGVSLKYMTTSGLGINYVVMQKDSSETIRYPETTSTDVSNTTTIEISNPTPSDYSIIFKSTKIITDGKDISQLDTSEIEVKYI